MRVWLVKPRRQQTHRPQRHARPPTQDIIQVSDDGLEWQLSVYIESGSVTEQQQGTVINGRTLEGAPVKHFKNAVIREISFTPTGTDTRAVILSPNLKKPPMEKLTQQLTEKEQRIAKLEAQITQKHAHTRLGQLKDLAMVEICSNLAKHNPTN